MRDEHDDRVYQAHRHDLATNVADIARSVAHAFDRLHERLYGAPWARQTRPNESRCETKLTTL
jgi:hypothetical protein